MQLLLPTVWGTTTATNTTATAYATICVRLPPPDFCSFVYVAVFFKCQMCHWSLWQI